MNYTPEEPRIRVILRWRTTREGIGFCYDCGVNLLSTPTDAPRVRVPHVTQDDARLIIRCEPLCWRCWRQHMAS